MRNNSAHATLPRADVPYLFRRAARAFPDAPAVDDGSRALRLGELVARAERFANALDVMGVPPDASVGILSENRAGYVEADVAIALARRVRVALNARLHLEDHRFVAADAGMRVLVHSGRFADVAEALHAELGVIGVSLDAPEGSSVAYDALVESGSPGAVQRPGDPEDPAWITYTSGTTGRPKGILLSHRSIREVALNLLLELGPVRPGELVVLPQPLSHGAGYFVLPWLMSGGGLVVMDRFDPERVYEIGERPEARTFKCVPAMLPPLLDVPGRSFGFDSIVYGASPIPRPVLDASLDRFGPVLSQVYGQSEAPVTITVLQPHDHRDEACRFSAGRPFRSVCVEVVDENGHPLPPGSEGEVAVTGSHLMTGYLGLPEATAEVLRDGWVMTKDMGVYDERGYLSLLGRRDEIINSGGFNISPREVENVLSGYPGVEEVCVVGIPDDRWGSAVTAMVKLNNGTAVTGEDLLAFARPRLGFRTPKLVSLVPSIPKTPYGKVDRPKVTAALADVYEVAG